MLCVTTGRAEPYWVAYEGNDFPENEGWERASSNPPAERWLESGSLFIDSRADVVVYDNYTIYSDGNSDPSLGETFIMRWKLKVHEATPWDDPGVYVISDDHYAVMFVFGEGYVSSTYEANVSTEFEPGVFHEFEMRSADMRSYELYIDGHLATEGAFSESLFPACTGFGDVVSSWSLAEWDYFRFGVVPEPPAWLGALFALPFIRRRAM